MKYQKALVASLLFVVLLLSIYYVHISYFKVNVVLYSSIQDGILAALLTSALLFGLRYFGLFDVFEKIQLLVIWILAGYIFAISIPTVIDRSLSFYLLEKIQQRGGGIQQARFDEIFTKEYVKEHHLLEIRLTEAQETGTVAIINGCVKLTPRGERIASFGRFFRQNLLPKQRLLMGKYTDVMTDPFRNSAEIIDYQCK